MVAGTATAVSNRVSRRQAGRWASHEQPQAQEQQPQQPAYQEPPPDDTSTKLAQLKELGELKAQGILTGAEFEQQKARILSS